MRPRRMTSRRRRGARSPDGGDLAGHQIADPWDPPSRRAPPSPIPQELAQAGERVDGRELTNAAHGFGISKSDSATSFRRGGLAAREIMREADARDRGLAAGIARSEPSAGRHSRGTRGGGTVEPGHIPCTGFHVKKEKL